MSSIKITLPSQATSIKLDTNLRIKAMKCCATYNVRVVMYNTIAYPTVIL